MTTWVVRLMTEIRVDVKGEEKELVGSWTVLTTRQPHRVTLVSPGRSRVMKPFVSRGKWRRWLGQKLDRLLWLEGGGWRMGAKERSTGTTWRLHPKIWFKLKWNEWSKEKILTGGGGGGGGGGSSFSFKKSFSTLFITSLRALFCGIQEIMFEAEPVGSSFKLCVFFFPILPSSFCCCCLFSPPPPPPPFFFFFFLIIFYSSSSISNCGHRRHNRSVDLHSVNRLEEKGALVKYKWTHTETDIKRNPDLLNEIIKPRPWTYIYTCMMLSYLK